MSPGSPQTITEPTWITLLILCFFSATLAFALGISRAGSTPAPPRDYPNRFVPVEGEGWTKGTIAVDQVTGQVCRTYQWGGPKAAIVYEELPLCADIWAATRNWREK